MTGKGKGKYKIKRTEIRVEGKIIDLPRFAYDVIAHAALKFGVPASCITKWTKGGENDYGYPDFISVLSGIVFEKQMLYRHYWYAEFKRHYESNSFESFRNIQCLLQRLFLDPTPQTCDLILMKVVCYMSIINELVLFLHSENCNLFLNELAVYWFKYLGPMKDELEKVRGLASLYTCRDHRSVGFFDRFIRTYCIPYNGSGKLYEIYPKEFDKECRKSQTPLDATVCSIADSLRAGVRLDHSEKDEASGIDLLADTGEGMEPHGESLRSIDVITAHSATSLQNLPSASGQRSGKDGRRQPSQKRRQKGVSYLRSRFSSSLVVSDPDKASGCDIPVNTGLGIPPHEEWYAGGILGRADNAASPQNMPSASGRRAGNPLKRELRKEAERKDISERRSQVSFHPATSERDESSAIDKPLNTGLGIWHEFLRGDCATRADDATSSSNITSPIGQRLKES